MSVARPFRHNCGGRGFWGTDPLTTPSADKLERRFVAPQEFARLSGLSLSTVYRYLKSGKLPFRQPNGRRGRILIAIDAIELARGEDKEQQIASNATPEPPVQEAPKLSGPRPKWARSS